MVTTISSCSYQFHISHGISDHAYALVQFGEYKKPKLSFKLCEMWKLHPQFMDLVKEAWSVDVNGVPMFRLVNNLKSVKAKLKGLHRGTFSDLQGRIDEVRKELEQARTSLSEQPNCVELQRRVKNLTSELVKLMNAEEAMARQQAKVWWLNHGDANTAYFHPQIKQRRAKNFITSITNGSGQCLKDSAAIQQEFLTYFEG